MASPDISRTQGTDPEEHRSTLEKMKQLADYLTRFSLLLAFFAQGNVMSSPLPQEADQPHPPTPKPKKESTARSEITDKVQQALEQTFQEDIFLGYKWSKLLSEVVVHRGTKKTTDEVEALFQLSASQRMKPDELAIVARRIIESKKLQSLLTELTSRFTQVTIVFAEPHISTPIRVHIDALTGEPIESKSDAIALAASAAMSSLKLQTAEYEEKGMLPPIAKEAAEFAAAFGKLKSRYYWAMWKAKLQPLLRSDNPITVNTLQQMCTPEVCEAWTLLKRAWLIELETMLESRWANFLPVVEHVSTICEEFFFAYEHLNLPVRDASKEIMKKIREYDASIEINPETNTPTHPFLVAQLNKERGAEKRNYWQLLHRYAYMQVGNENGD